MYINSCCNLLLSASGDSQQFPGPPESLKPDRFSCCPHDQSLSVYYITPHHINIHLIPYPISDIYYGHLSLI